MQTPIRKFPNQSSPNSLISFQPKLLAASNPTFNSALEWIRVLLTLAGVGIGIAAILTFQQLLIQLYAARWQMALLFALIGLMVALLLRQYRLEQTVKSARVAIHWSVLSSLTVTLLGIGMVICILNTTPPLT